MKFLARATAAYKSIAAIFILSMLQVMTYAQDSSGNSSGTSGSTSGGSTSSSTTSTLTEQHTWYGQPWVWIIGGAVLLLIIIALVSGGGNKTARGTTDRVTYTKKVTKENDI
ncbi:hypothetical protein BH09BAC2_BH09BAC2_10650 [soil metagenome]